MSKIQSGVKTKKTYKGGATPYRPLLNPKGLDKLIQTFEAAVDRVIAIENGKRVKAAEKKAAYRELIEQRRILCYQCHVVGNPDYEDFNNTGKSGIFKGEKLQVEILRTGRDYDVLFGESGADPELGIASELSEAA